MQASSAFEGDKYFTGTSYKINNNGEGQIKSYSEILNLAGESTKLAQWDKPVINMD